MPSEVGCEQVEDYLLERLVKAALIDRDATSPDSLPPSKLIFIKDTDLKNTNEYLETQMWEYHAKRGAEVRLKDYPSTISCLKQCKQGDSTFNS